MQQFERYQFLVSAVFTVYTNNSKSPSLCLYLSEIARKIYHAQEYENLYEDSLRPHTTEARIFYFLIISWEKLIKNFSETHSFLRKLIIVPTHVQSLLSRARRRKETNSASWAFVLTLWLILSEKWWIDTKI